MGIFRAAAFALLPVLALACKTPEQPTFTITDAQVTSVEPTGLTLAVKADAANPNAFDLNITSFTGKVTLDGKYDLGEVSIKQPVTLAASSHSEITVPLTGKWPGADVITALAAATKPVPYTVAGTVRIGGGSLSVDLPVTARGSITRDQIAGMAIRNLPAIPGLPNIPLPQLK